MKENDFFIVEANELIDKLKEQIKDKKVFKAEHTDDIYNEPVLKRELNIISNKVDLIIFDIKLMFNEFDGHLFLKRMEDINSDNYALFSFQIDKKVESLISQLEKFIEFINKYRD